MHTNTLNTNKNHAKASANGNKTISSFEHITINTGHTRLSKRNEVPDQLVAYMKNWFNTSQPLSLEGDSKISFVNAIPGCPGFIAILTPNNGVLLVTVLHEDRPCISFGIADKTPEGESLWKILHDDPCQFLPTFTDPKKLPRTPWCAVRFDPGFVYLSSKDQMWLGDFERYVAWMWFELNDETKSRSKTLDKNNAPPDQRDLALTSRPVGDALKNVLSKSGRKEAPQFICTENKGQAIVKTNYWDSELAIKGLLYLTWNAGAARLLLPDSQKLALREMRGAKYVIISRGPSVEHGGGDALELLFEDNSDAPFSIHLSVEQSDRTISVEESGKEFFVTVWTRGGEKLRLPGKYRQVDSIPCLQEWKATPPPMQKNTGKDKRLNPRQIIKEGLASFPHALIDYPYHSSLPPELEEWHCYTIDGGHSIYCLVKSLADKAFETNRVDDYMVAISVKTVLRGYQMREGYVVVDAVYDSLVGVECIEDDFEFMTR